MDQHEPFKYHLTYDFEAHPEGLSKDEVEAMGKSACSAFFAASILYPPDGSYSVLFMSKDGRTNEELPDGEWFKLFLMLSKRLSQSKTLDEGRRMLAGMPFEAWVKFFSGGPCSDPECAHSHDEAPPSDETH